MNLSYIYMLKVDLWSTSARALGFLIGQKKCTHKMDNESVHKSGQKKCTHKMDKKSVHTKMGTSDQIVIINRM